MEANTDGAGSRRMETIALRYSQGKKKKKENTHCPVFLLFFIYTMENPPWRYHGRTCGSPALGSGADVLGRFSFPSRPVPHTVSWTCCRLTTAFPLLLLLLLQVGGLRDFLSSRWWPVTGGLGAGSSAHAPQWSCLSPRTSCTCSGWQKPHCSRSGTS